ncbi:DegT/DnrJ/EryC1/StrS family aminotransferase [Epilithonimonas arachidiradicis]|uniref:dTDP-4-amino-4,6-dideoxygalactose transaminase n=2 Tax=Epilithonimonas arachidiradicis TaxID=1617282 RepID=A0A420DC08_9FLAO|nr:aminotransferase class I/II-fold pyridoxal phosphate-dependent enzyme [Epilithonimonas arachidiradicis]RKE89001.1 dTDP-4-amino-4,6-dideoxygalactose transaminase [Epilithonimonas arachidiradicis]
MKSKIWLSSPHMGGGEMKYIQQAFDENWISPLGPNVNGFESDLEMFLNDGVHIAALMSGTSAIHIALMLLKVKPGDDVICQSLTFSASANPIMYLGANPVFIDSEPDTWNLCPVALEEAIIDGINRNNKPKAIIAVSIYGMPYKIDEIRKISDKYNIPIIEDSAEALGSMYKNKKCGTFGDLSVLSFNGNKIITSSGGGALVVKNRKYKDKAVFLSTQAKDEAPHYQHSELGYNYRLSNICAGIGRGQMEVLDQRILERRANHEFYKKVFEDIEDVTIFSEPSDDYYSNYWLNNIIINPSVSGVDREKVRLKLLEENIESRPLWKPLHLQPIFKTSKYFGDNNVAENLFNTGLCLPSGSNLTLEDKDRIASCLRMCFNK